MPQSEIEKKSITLLLVDDDTSLREDMVTYFQRAGYRVIDCGTAADALSLADRQHVDVIILDMILPDMSGLDVLEKLRSRGCDSEIVMLTGEGTI